VLCHCVRSINLKTKAVPAPRWAVAQKKDIYHILFFIFHSHLKYSIYYSISLCIASCFIFSKVYTTLPLCFPTCTTTCIKICQNFQLWILSRTDYFHICYFFTYVQIFISQKIYLSISLSLYISAIYDTVIFITQDAPSNFSYYSLFLSVSKTQREIKNPQFRMINLQYCQHINTYKSFSIYIYSLSTSIFVQYYKH
jgi:hypothetical protein